MKKILLLFSLLLNIITLRGMEASSMAPLGEKRKGNKQIILQNDFKNHLRDCLQSFKTSTFFDDDIRNIQDKYTEMTNKKSMSFLGDCLHKEVCDEDGNNFVHYAAKNREARIIDWAIRCMKRPLSMSNKFDEEPIDFCIGQLMPGALEKNKDEAYKAFTALTTGYGKIGFDHDHRRKFITKIVMWEFEYIKQGKSFPFKVDDVLECFRGQDIELSDIYQEIRDAEENSFAHMLVSHHLSDMLHSFLIKNYITFAVNKEGKDPLALAQKNHLAVGRNRLARCVPSEESDSPKVSQEDQQKKCCYFMLLNWQKKKDDTGFNQCCDKHIVEKN